MSGADSGWRRWLRIWQRTPAHDVDAELQFHLDERSAELMASGADPDAARAQVAREFGDLRRVRQGLIDIDQRITRRRDWRDRCEWIGQDLRYVLRSLRRSPGFLVTVTVTLALGLGANAAMFSVLDRLFISPPPGIAQPHQVMRVYRLDPRGKAEPAARVDRRSIFAYQEFADLRQALGGAYPLTGFNTGTAELGTGSDVKTIGTSNVLVDYFKTLGVRPALGRFFSADELRPESPVPVIVISDAFWRMQLNAQPDVVGSHLHIDGHDCTVIGVAPPGFRGADNDAVDVWLPMNTAGWDDRGEAWYQGTHTFWITMLARLPDARAVAIASASASASFRHETIMPDSLAAASIGPLVERGDREFHSQEIAIATRLGGVAVIILLIACANVAGLLMIRNAGRRRELAVRLALGVSRRRLAVLLLLETGVIVAAATIVAVAVAYRGAIMLRTLVLPGIRWGDSPLNWHVVAFAFVAAGVACLLSGFAPARYSSRADLMDALKTTARDGGVAQGRWRTLLLWTQVTLSMLLLIGAGVFVRSLHSVETQSVGFDMDRIVFATATADREHAARNGDILRRMPDLERQLARLPGVDQTALEGNMDMYGVSFVDIRIPGVDTSTMFSQAGPSVSWVSPNYFATVGLRVVRGRGLQPGDAAGGATVINQAMASKFWPGRDPLGQCVEIDGHPCVTVVGIVSNSHQGRLIESFEAEKFYLHIVPPDTGGGSMRTGNIVVLRTRPGTTDRVVRDATPLVQREFAGWATPSVRPMTRNAARELRPWQVGARLFLAAGLLALIVAVVGIYSVIAFGVEQRVREIGVRMALGARGQEIMALVLRQVGRVVVAGIASGVVIGVAGGRIIESMLYRTTTHDPVVLVIVAGALMLAATLACAIPALRASRVDPATALRAE